MKYLPRHLEQKITKLSKNFKAVLLVGARQVGKSTLLKHLFPQAKTFVFDPVRDIYDVSSDPDLFLKNFPTPLILDEIQFAPELLPALKRFMDESDGMGQYFLTGSQNLALLKTVSESMAGRVAIVPVHPMTPYEMTETTQKTVWLEHLFTDPMEIPHIYQSTLPLRLFEYLWRGSLPGITHLDSEALSTYFQSYIQTYVERDIRTLGDIQDLKEFSRFLTLLAVLTAQEANYSHLGRELGISPTTALRWKNLLEGTYQLHEIWPYYGNAIKRLSKKSKLYFCDTGLACYLQKMSSPETLAGHPHLGPLFETACVNLIKTLAQTLSTPPAFYHWRTNGGSEVDLVLERDGLLYPIEIKCKTQLGSRDFNGIRAFKETYPTQFGCGLVMYAGDLCYQKEDKLLVIPWNIA